MSNIVLYSTNCPKCRVLEIKLKSAKLNYTVVTDTEKVIAVGKANNILSAPILQIDDVYLDFSAALTYLKG